MGTLIIGLCLIKYWVMNQVWGTALVFKESGNVTHALYKDEAHTCLCIMFSKLRKNLSTTGDALKENIKLHIKHFNLNRNLI